MADIYVSSGVTSNGVVLSGAYWDNCDTMYILSAGTANRTTMSGGYMHVSSGGVANSTTVNTSGRMDIYNGGVANSTTVNTSGRIFISSGGVANSTTVNGDQATARISSGAVASNTIVSSGYMDIKGGVASDTTIFSGYMFVKDSGVANSTTVNDGNMTISSGGVANSTTMSGGYMHVSSGVANSTTINSGGCVNISSGGVANSTTVNFSGHMYISCGGVANKTTVNGTDYYGHSYLTVSSGGTANSTTVNFKGKIYVSSGGVANNTVISSGHLFVSSGGVANNTVTSGGSMSVFSGGIICGLLKIASGAVVSADYGSIIDFTVAEQTAPETALINNWSLIQGGADALYTLTVEADQEDGLYILATGASGFSNSVTVKTTENKTLGTLSAGQTKTFGNTDYTLSLTGGNLALTISGEEPVTKPAKSDVDGNGVSDIVFQWTGNNYQIGFWMNGTNDWQSQGGNQPQDWELIGAYDMDQNGKADIVMRGNIQIGSDKGAYIGYYTDGDVTNWQNISYLNNPNDIDWRLAIGNITGNEGCNSLVWYSPELGALGIWTDGTDNWVSLGNGYDYSWTLKGCGDFNGDGKDDILFSLDGNLYCTDIDNNFRSLGGWGTDWKVCTTGDFSGDGTDDIIVQKGNMVVKFKDGLAENWESLGTLDAEDWFIVGAGDYNGDQKEDLLVRQYSTGMLGYYSGGDMDKWVEVGRGVDMNWTVIA